MRTQLWIIGLTAAPLGALLLGAQAQETDPKRIYAANCQSCHVPPDTRFASDRAWLAQIYETS